MPANPDVPTEPEEGAVTGAGPAVPASLGHDASTAAGSASAGSCRGVDHDAAVGTEPPPTATRSGLRALAFGATAAVCAAVVVLLGIANPPAPDGVSTDRLGPDTGETIAVYLDRARASLSGTDDSDRWALVSFAGYRPAAALPGLPDGVRVSQALYQVPLPRVAAPLVAVQVPAEATALTRSGTDAAWQLADRRRYAADGTRGAQVLDVSIARLRAGCACSPGLVVRAPLSRLRELAGRPGVRAVQALPADAVAERFAVAPLLPDSADPVAPRPDDGPVPAG